MNRRLLLALLCCLCLKLQAANTELVFPLYFGAVDGRGEFDWIVLGAALERTVPTHGSYTLAPWREPMSVPRMLQELATPNGRINVIARASDRDLESRFQPVRIPIDRGLQGMRLLLVRKADLPRFAAVRTLQDLRHFSAGQGSIWVDTQVLNAAGFKVVETATPGNLMGMLEAGRFDFFPRALDEAPNEYDAVHRLRPDIVIEPTLMLRYPLPRYFFVRRNADGDKLAERIRAGLELMVRDGSLAALFRKHKGPLVERAGIGKRRIINLQNPALPPETPLERSELWFQP